MAKTSGKQSYQKSEEDYPKGYITEAGNKQEKGEYYYRGLEVTDAKTGDVLEGEHWSKDEGTIDAHVGFKKNKTLISYNWNKGAKGQSDKLRVYPIKDEDDEDEKPAKSTSKGKSSGGKSTYPSNYQKTAAAKEEYWEGKTEFDKDKWEWEKTRFSRNDRKIEFQAYFSVVGPFFLEQYKADLQLALAADSKLPTPGTYLAQADKVTQKLFDAHNPATSSSDEEESE